MWEVKRDNDPKVYALCNAQKDAELLAFNLNCRLRDEEPRFYARKKA